MKITPIQVTIADLTKNYKDDVDGGVFRLLRHFIYCPTNLPHNGIQRRYGHNTRAHLQQ